MVCYVIFSGKLGFLLVQVKPYVGIVVLYTRENLEEFQPILAHVLLRHVWVEYSLPHDINPALVRIHFQCLIQINLILSNLI